MSNLPVVFLGELGPNTDSMTNEKIHMIRNDLSRYIKDTIIHFGHCSMGLECYLCYDYEKDGIIYFKFTEDSSYGYCPGSDEIQFTIDGEIYLSCNIDENCEKCWILEMKPTADPHILVNMLQHDKCSKEYHDVCLKLPNSEDGVRYTHKFDGCDGIDIKNGISFSLEWIESIFEENDKMDKISMEESGINQDAWWKYKELRKRNQCTLYQKNDEFDADVNDTSDEFDADISDIPDIWDAEKGEFIA